MGQGIFREFRWFQRHLKPGTTPTGIPAGIHQFRRETDQEKHRLHLRVDQDGSGTLIINASSILHLNPTASLIAYHHLKGETSQIITSRSTKSLIPNPKTWKSTFS